MSSPTQRTLAECKKRGHRAHIVERWIAQARKRVDCFGFGDVLVLDGKPGSLLVQCTTTANAPARLTKMKTQCREACLDWLSAGNRIEIWGWAKRGGKGKRKLWTLKVYVVDEDSFELVNS